MVRRNSIKDAEKKEPKRTVDQNLNLFSEDWMNKCYKEVIYPDPSCTKVLEKVSAALANRVLRPQNSEQKQQALFYLLGPEFTEQNFPRSKLDHMALEPPKMQPQQKAKYVADMRRFLKEALKKSLKDCNYPENMIGYDKEDELGQYLKEVKEVFAEGLRKQSSVVMFESDSEKQQRSRGKDEDYKPPICQMREVDVAGNALIALTKYDKEKKNIYKAKLKSKAVFLPLTLRRFFWFDFVSSLESKKLKIDNDEQIRENITNKFREQVLKNLKSNKSNRLPDVNNNKNKDMIDDTVIQVYENCPALEELESDEYMIATARILNILDCHSKNFSPTLIFMVAPLQCIYHKPNEYEKEDQYMVEMAAELELNVRYSRIDIEDCWDLAKEIVEYFTRKDEEYIEFINKKLSEQDFSSIKVKDFPPESLSKKNPEKLYEELNKNGVSKYKDLFSNIEVFIRKWIIQAFVGVLSISSALWCWDQLMLNEWSTDTMKQIAMSVLLLIRPWVMRKKDPSGVIKVLQNEPRKLYLKDIQKGYLFYRDGRPDVPENSNYKGIKLDQPKNKGKDAEASSSKTSKPLLPILPVASDNLFDLKINIDSDSDHDSPIPSPEPRQDDVEEQENKKEPPPPKRHSSPIVVPSAPDIADIWIPQDTDKLDLPKATSISEPFELYIDSVRCLPDCITICKVTGKLLRYSNNERDKAPEMVGFPVQQSPQICPLFRSRLIANKEKQDLNPTMIILLRVYGVQRHDEQIVVVGSAVINPFTSEDSPPKLRVGGYQLRLRHGLPTGNLDKLTEDKMKECQAIPGTTICIRLLPHQKTPVSPPLYEQGFYESGECKPTETEMVLYQHYAEAVDYDTETVGDSARRLQRLAKIPQNKDGPALLKFIENRLNHKAVLLKHKKPIPDMDYSRFLTYDITSGLNVDVQCAFGLPRKADSMYTMAYCEILPGKETLHDEENDDDPPVRFQMSTIHIDFLSSTRSPQWLDESTNMRPIADENSMLLVKIFGISPSYSPIDGFTPGEIKNVEGGDFKINLDRPLVWTIAPLFFNEFVIGGLHWLPLFEGFPPESLLHRLRMEKNVKKILLDAVKKDEISVAEGASIEIKIWDDQLQYEDLPEVSHDNIIQLFPPVKKFKDVRTQKFTKTFDNFVVDSMDVKRVTNLREIEKERDLFKDVANMVFFKALNKALEENGKEIIPRYLYMSATPPPSPGRKD